MISPIIDIYHIREGAQKSNQMSHVTGSQRDFRRIKVARSIKKTCSHCSFKFDSIRTTYISQ
jgi:hypothetical protein